MNRLETDDEGLYVDANAWYVRVTDAYGMTVWARASGNGEMMVSVVEEIKGEPTLHVTDTSSSDWATVLMLEHDEFAEATIASFSALETVWLQGCARNGDD